jgi:hypothetical protein
MQNEFEKQVQQKLEELNFTPSEPVWLNIEKEIQGKKDKRRLFIWIPLIITLLSGSVFIFYNSQKRSTPLTKDYDKVKSHETVEANNNSGIDKNVIKNKAGRKDETTDSKMINGNTIPENNTINKSVAAYKINKVKSRKNNDKEQLNYAVISGKNNIKEQNVVTTVSDNYSIQRSNQTDIENNNQHEKITFPINHFNKINATPLINFSREDIVNRNLITKLDKVIPPINKWKLLLEFSPGFSKIIDHSVYSNTAIAYNNPGTYPSSGGSSSSSAGSFQNGFSFQVGVGLQKYINERFLIATGIEYSYFSSKSMVGTIVRQDTVIKSYAVSQYYLNSNPANNNATVATSPYLNKLHFIGIPVTLHYSLFKNLPFSIYGGIKIQDLIASDLLIYDPSWNVYYSSKEALNHLQFFSVGGLEYTFQLRNLKINVGPQLTYGLSNIVKSYNNHLLNIAATVKIYIPEKKK